MITKANGDPLDKTVALALQACRLETKKNVAEIVHEALALYLKPWADKKIKASYYAVIHEDGTVDHEAAFTNRRRAILSSDGLTIAQFIGPPSERNIHRVKAIADPEFFDAFALVSTIKATLMLEKYGGMFGYALSKEFLPLVFNYGNDYKIPDEALERIGWYLIGFEPATRKRACHLWLAWKNISDFFTRCDDRMKMAFCQDTLRNIERVSKFYYYDTFPKIPLRTSLEFVPRVVEELRKTYYGPPVPDTTEPKHENFMLTWKRRYSKATMRRIRGSRRSAKIDAAPADQVIAAAPAVESSTSSPVGGVVQSA